MGEVLLTEVQTGTYLCFPVPMFPGTYVPRYLCSPVKKICLPLPKKLFPPLKKIFFTPPQKMIPP